MAHDEEVRRLRTRINDLDDELLALLAQRREMSQRVITAKQRGQSPLRDQGREEELLVRLIRLGRQHGLDAHFVTRVFHEIIDDSIRLQQQRLQQDAHTDDEGTALIRIAFQGIEGSYSHLAAREFFSRNLARLDFRGLETFAQVVKAVEDGEADYAMLPIENTTSGGINEVYDLLLHTRLSIVGEEKYRVQHCLVATEDIAVEDVRRVFSHPQAVAQCTRFLGTLEDCKVEFHTDTAMSVARIKEEGDRTQAAIASEEAARLFGLHVIGRDIANQDQNFTRFLVAARKARGVDARIPCKTSLVMATGQQPGSLVEALLIFRERSLPLSKLESRPILGNPWEEMFYVDFEGNPADSGVRAALDDLTRVTRFLKVLGTYPTQDLPRTSLPAGEIARRDSSPAKSIAARRREGDAARVSVADAEIGGEEMILLAGPPWVESAEQMMTCARHVSECGARILWSRCFGGRRDDPTEGLGLKGLEMLVDAGRAYGLGVLVEVIAPEHVEAVAQVADALRIGPPDMENYSLLRAVGRVHKPVLLQRGLTASADELLEAADVILGQGNQQVMLCEAGVRTVASARRATLDLGLISAVHQASRLPLLVDPTRCATGPEDMMLLARSAKLAGAAGLLLPVTASSAAEGASLDAARLGALAEELLA